MFFCYLLFVDCCLFVLFLVDLFVVFLTYFDHFFRHLLQAESAMKALESVELHEALQSDTRRSLADVVPRDRLLGQHLFPPSHVFFGPNLDPQQLLNAMVFFWLYFETC